MAKRSSRNAPTTGVYRPSLDPSARDEIQERRRPRRDERKVLLLDESDTATEAVADACSGREAEATAPPARTIASGAKEKRGDVDPCVRSNVRDPVGAKLAGERGDLSAARLALRFLE